jgi:hypothetical protein
MSNKMSNGIELNRKQKKGNKMSNALKTTSKAKTKLLKLVPKRMERVGRIKRSASATCGWGEDLGSIVRFLDPFQLAPYLIDPERIESIIQQTQGGEHDLLFDERTCKNLKTTDMGRDYVQDDGVPFTYRYYTLTLHSGVQFEIDGELNKSMLAKLGV